ncbi:hypothetical protein SCUP234_05620 [Seiridium cupressi]
MSITHDSDFSFASPQEIAFIPAPNSASHTSQPIETMATLMDHLDGLTNEQLRRIILDMCVKKDTNEERIVNIIRQWNDKTSPEEHEGPQAKRRRPADDAGSVPPKATTPSVTAGNTQVCDDQGDVDELMRLTTV